MSSEEGNVNSINITLNYNNNTNFNSSLNNNLLQNLNSSLPSTIVQKSSSSSFFGSLKLFVESIPQTYLLMCVLVLFILFFIVIIIIFICLIKKRKKLLQTETIVNNNKIDINKMILQNSNNIRPNLKEFQAIQNNSNVSDYGSGNNNMSLCEIKTKNLKEEIHSIVSGTLNEITINKSRKMKRKKRGNSTRLIGPQSEKNENNNIIVTSKELNNDNKQKDNNDIIL
jgi:preprotein translocase subunit SecG